MIEVNSLNKGLDLGSLVKLSLAHGLNNLSGITINASDYK